MVLPIGQATIVQKLEVVGTLQPFLQVAMARSTELSPMAIWFDIGMTAGRIALIVGQMVVLE